MDIIIRPGKKEDANVIAHYMSLASGGIVEFLLHDLIENVSPIQMMQKSIEEEGNELSFTNTIIAELSGQVVGMVHAFPLILHKMPEGSLIPQKRLEHLKDFFECNLPDSYYLHTIAVDSTHEGKHIGTKLFRAIEEKAKLGNYTTLSLHVWCDNGRALNWYTKLGFTKVKSIHINPAPLLPHDEGMVFMKKIL